MRSVRIPRTTENRDHHNDAVKIVTEESAIRMSSGSLCFRLPWNQAKSGYQRNLLTIARSGVGGQLFTLILCTGLAALGAKEAGERERSGRSEERSWRATEKLESDREAGGARREARERERSGKSEERSWRAAKSWSTNQTGISSPYGQTALGWDCCAGLPGPMAASLPRFSLF